MLWRWLSADTTPGAPKVRVKPPPASAPVLVKLIVDVMVEPLMMLLLAPKANAPAYVAAVLPLLSKAPVALTPVPRRVSTPVLVMVWPLRSSAAPSLTETAPEPIAVALPAFSVPAEMVVPPL